MITNSKQSWKVGQTVKVGFLTLKVLGARAEKDYLPDIYTLSNLDGSRFYEFIPHNGLSRISREEALEHVSTQETIGVDAVAMLLI